MAAVLITSNLVFSSQVAGAANRAGVELQTLNNQDGLMAAAAGASVLLVDLSTPGMRIADLVARARLLEPPPAEIVAFGPHVHQARQMAARSAGCDVVLAQGAFVSAMNEILARAAARERH